MKSAYHIFLAGIKLCENKQTVALSPLFAGSTVNLSWWRMKGDSNVTSESGSCSKFSASSAPDEISRLLDVLVKLRI